MEEEEKQAGESGKSFPVQCYNLARQLVDEIRFQFDEHKTDRDCQLFWRQEHNLESKICFQGILHFKLIDL